MIKLFTRRMNGNSIPHQFGLSWKQICIVNIILGIDRPTIGIRLQVPGRLGEDSLQAGLPVDRPALRPLHQAVQAVFLSLCRRGRGSLDENVRRRSDRKE